MNRASRNLEHLVTNLDTCMALDRHGRLVSQNFPDLSPAPQLLILGCESGNVFGVRRDVPGEVVHRIVELVATEPPLFGPNSRPVHLDQYLDLLSGDMTAQLRTPNMVFLAPDRLTYSHEIHLVCSGTPEGDRLTGKIRVEGMPPELVGLGFSEIDDLWLPWCIAMNEEQPAAIGFTARLGDRGAEAGVMTVPELRRRGFGAAAVSGWLGHQDLRGKTLFYSTNRSNGASQQVAQKLGLKYLGSSFSIF